MKGNKILKAGLGYTIGNYFIKGLAFLTLPIFARIMSTEDFGIYNIFISYEGIFLYLIGFGLETSFKSARYRYGRVGENISSNLCYEEYVSTMVLLVFGIGSAWIAMLTLFQRQASTLLGLDYISILLLILFSMSNAVILCFNSHVSINYDYKKYVIIGAINAIGSTVLSISLIKGLFVEKAYLGRMLGTTSVIIVLAIYVLIGFLRGHAPGHFKEYSGWGLRFCLPIIPPGISQVILANFDRVMIGRMVGDSEAGIYAFAYNIFAIIYVTYRSLDPVWSTWFFEKMKGSKFDEIRRYSGLYILLMFMISSIVMLISPELVLILGSAKYKDAVYCVIPIVAGGFFTYLYSIPCQVEYYREKTQFIAMGTTIAALTNIILNYIFIKKYGYVAAAYTTLVTYILYFTFHFFMAWRIEKKQLFSEPAIIICSVGIILVAAFALFVLNNRAVRFAAIAVFVLVNAVYGVKNYKPLLQSVISKRREHE